MGKNVLMPALGGGGGCASVLEASSSFANVLEASSLFGAKRELASSTVGFLFQNAHKGPPKVKGNSFPASEVYCGKKSPGSRGHSLKF